MVNFFFFFFYFSFWHLQSPKWVHSLAHLNIDPPPVQLNNWSKFNLTVQSEQASINAMTKSKTHEEKFWYMSRKLI